MPSPLCLAQKLKTRVLLSSSARAASFPAWQVTCRGWSRLGAGASEGVRLAWHPALQDVLAVTAGTRVLLLALDDLGPPTNGPVRAGRDAAMCQDTADVGPCQSPLLNKLVL